jgi:hypothetical protein
MDRRTKSSSLLSCEAEHRYVHSHDKYQHWQAAAVGFAERTSQAVNSDTQSCGQVVVKGLPEGGLGAFESHDLV